MCRRPRSAVAVGHAGHVGEADSTLAASTQLDNGCRLSLTSRASPSSCRNRAAGTWAAHMPSGPHVSPGGPRGCSVAMRCRRPICDTHWPLPVHDHVQTCIMHYRDMPCIAVEQPVMLHASVLRHMCRRPRSAVAVGQVGHVGHVGDAESTSADSATRIGLCQCTIIFNCVPGITGTCCASPWSSP